MAEIQLKSFQDRDFMTGQFARALKAVVREKADAADFDDVMANGPAPYLHPMALLRTFQGLAIAEHRRYGPGGSFGRDMDAVGGGRFLFGRLALGVAFHVWTVAEAADVALSPGRLPSLIDRAKLRFAKFDVSVGFEAFWADPDPTAL